MQPEGKRLPYKKDRGCSWYSRVRKVVLVSPKGVWPEKVHSGSLYDIF